MYRNRLLCCQQQRENFSQVECTQFTGNKSEIISMQKARLRLSYWLNYSFILLFPDQWRETKHSAWKRKIFFRQKKSALICHASVLQSFPLLFCVRDFVSKSHATQIYIDYSLSADYWSSHKIPRSLRELKFKFRAITLTIGWVPTQIIKSGFSGPTRHLFVTNPTLKYKITK